MNQSISTNTQAILLLTAPLITGNGAANGELLTNREYRWVARQLRELGYVPADLLGNNSAELLRELETVIPADRIHRLLDRGFLISQAVERWHSRAIWVISRADSEYPTMIKNRLKEDSPTVLYGCGQPRLLEKGGLAIVGSRHVDQTLIDYTESVGQQCAAAKKSVVSGGAAGIDRAAMRGALEAGGRVAGVLADSLERAVLHRDNRNWLLDEQMVLVSPYDPSAGFNVGHAMQRNKLIYALADAALVVSAEYEKGGTWAGATEQLQKLRFVTVYVRSTGDVGDGLQALQKMGAQPWPNPKSLDEFLATFDLAVSIAANSEQQSSLPLSAGNTNSSDESAPVSNLHQSTPPPRDSDLPAAENRSTITDHNDAQNHAESLIAFVRNILIDVLAKPKTEKEVSTTLQISKSQTSLWLQRFVEEGLIEKRTKPVKYVLRQKTLL
ncbi:MAG TPA: DNA-processing protein DprA [Candidatus Angelobacter sp.]|jgi:predicted Rossmann fold nucleotide-binding protein DprA/Smf involved in DNA uptake|nr:DNA-processing protein DprA [Candidatus Angelobacter sp.]